MFEGRWCFIYKKCEARVTAEQLNLINTENERFETRHKTSNSLKISRKIVSELW